MSRASPDAVREVVDARRGPDQPGRRRRLAGGRRGGRRDHRTRPDRPPLAARGPRPLPRRRRAARPPPRHHPARAVVRRCPRRCRLDRGRGRPARAAPHPRRTSWSGVLSTVGQVEVDELAPDACDLVELYADQARLALDLLHEHHVLVEHLRLSDAAQSVLYRRVRAARRPRPAGVGRRPLAEMMRAGAVWSLRRGGIRRPRRGGVVPRGGRGSPRRRHLHPRRAVGRHLLERRHHPHRRGLAAARTDRRARPPAAGAASPRSAAAPASAGRCWCSAATDDEPWAEHERDALAGLGRRLGSVVEQLETRRRDRHLVDELRELDQYRRDLVASLTHDLKTPLTAIALNAELLESDRRLAEAGVHPVAAIRRSAERLSSLVDDLLALARAEEGLAGDQADDDRRGDAGARRLPACRGRGAAARAAVRARPARDADGLRGRRRPGSRLRQRDRQRGEVQPPRR